MGGAWSEIEINRVGGRSRLTSCLSVAPLKILSPGVGAEYCSAVLSGYGGGLVAGDCARLRVRCGRGAKLFLGTQAYTKIYKSTDGQVARQEIEGHIDRDACVVSLPDPVVPYADSAFVQEQVWRLEAGALLVLLDGATAGRNERGERFQFGSYTSNITVYVEDEPVLVERFNAQPDAQAPDRIGSFGEYAAWTNIFVIGATGADGIASVLREALAPLLAAQAEKSASGVMVSLSELRPGVTALRALGHSSGSLDPIVRSVAEAAASPTLLGENPLLRKY